MLREEFEYRPTIKVRVRTFDHEASGGSSSVRSPPQVSQFFGGGFAQAKVSFVSDVIRLCKNKHQMLWKKQRDARIKVETKGYRPNARLQAAKTVADGPVKSPKRR